MSKIHVGVISLVWQVVQRINMHSWELTFEPRYSPAKGVDLGQHKRLICNLASWPFLRSKVNSQRILDKRTTNLKTDFECQILHASLLSDGSPCTCSHEIHMHRIINVDATQAMFFTEFTMRICIKPVTNIALLEQGTILKSSGQVSKFHKCSVFGLRLTALNPLYFPFP